MPIIERLSERTGNKEYIWTILENMPKYCANQVNHEFKDIAIN